MGWRAEGFRRILPFPRGRYGGVKVEAVYGCLSTEVAIATARNMKKGEVIYSVGKKSK